MINETFQNMLINNEAERNVSSVGWNKRSNYQSPSSVITGSCKYRKTPVFTGKKSFIALGSDVKSS